MRRNWKYTVHGVKDVIGDEDMDPIAKRDRIVKLIRISRWYKDQKDGEYSDLGLALEDLADAETIDDMDEVLETIYDLADDERAWIA